MTENVKLITTQNFDDISRDFYKNINDEYLMTREQIGTALGYKNLRKAIENALHCRCIRLSDKDTDEVNLAKVIKEAYINQLLSESEVSLT